MDDYIKRSQIKYSYTPKRFAEHSELCRAYNDGVKSMELHIAEIPTADVVEVVRCKDCKYFVKYKCRADGGMEQMMCTLVNGTYDENWYCADGVAKMDGKDE